jgi:hypothetical protein
MPSSARKHGGNAKTPALRRHSPAIFPLRMMDAPQNGVLF